MIDAGLGDMAWARNLYSSRTDNRECVQIPSVELQPVMLTCSVNVNSGVYAVHFSASVGGAQNIFTARILGESGQANGGSPLCMKRFCALHWRCPFLTSYSVH